MVFFIKDSFKIKWKENGWKRKRKEINARYERTKQTRRVTIYFVKMEREGEWRNVALKTRNSREYLQKYKDNACIIINNK